MILLAEFRRQPRQVENFDGEPHFGKHRLGHLTSRHDFDISPGQVCSPRVEPLTIKMRSFSLAPS